MAALVHRGNPSRSWGLGDTSRSWGLVNWTEMKPDVEPASPAETEWVASQRRWTQGWRRFVLPGVFLVYLLYVAQAVAQNSHGAGAAFGYAVLAAFSACWLLVVSQSPHATRRRLWMLYALLCGLFLVELPFAHAAAFTMCLYITTITVGLLGVRSVPIVLALALAALFVPVGIPSWHDSLGASIDNVTPVAILVVALVTVGVLRVVEGNRELAQARAELARLAAENERFRIARDLHDLLGHSLTTITVKAGFARQVGEADSARALHEIAEVETLARRSLADVRAAVGNYRDVTLAGELATGRELLRAAGITADLPRAVDVVDPNHQELFGWVVREGLTNIVRHAHASSCAVRLSASSVEIVDDGVGGAGPPGNGLSGLRERVASVGGVIDAGPLQPKGWRLRVSLAPDGVV
jgi:two-component system, NarL family, sensor histidine kinase DesK